MNVYQAYQYLTGKSIKEIADEAGVSKSTVRRYINGTSNNPKVSATLIKGLRTSAGLSQRDMAVLMGVSQSTVSRSESRLIKGKGTPNVNVANFYKMAQKHPEDFATYVTNYKEVTARIAELSNDAIGEKSPALKNIYSKKSALNMKKSMSDIRDMKRAIVDLDRFLNMKTSTVEGTSDWLRNVEDASSNTSGLSLSVENKKFWDVYNKMKYDPRFSKDWMGREYDSAQKIEDIKEFMSNNRWSFDGEYTPEQIIEKMYNERMELEMKIMEDYTEEDFWS